jgi:hypothetical protein
MTMALLTSDTYGPAAFASASLIVYDTEWSAGRIRAIFDHSRKHKDNGNVDDTFLVVDVYAPLSDEHAKLDHFRPFPYHTGGRLFYDRFQSKAALFRKSDILCHFLEISALEVEGIPEPCIWTLPFNKVPIVSVPQSLPSTPI